MNYTMNFIKLFVLILVLICSDQLYSRDSTNYIVNGDFELDGDVQTVMNLTFSRLHGSINVTGSIILLMHPGILLSAQGPDIYSIQDC